MSISSENEGWTWLSNATKWHYFVGGRSLCGRYALLGRQELVRGDNESPDNCKECWRRLVKREANVVK